MRGPKASRRWVVSTSRRVPRVRRSTASSAGETARRRARTPAADRLRRVLRARPDRFRLERVIPVVSRLAGLDGAQLLVYRSRCAGPAGAAPIAPWVPQLRRRVVEGMP